MENRAYSLLEIKSVSEDQRVIRGTATTPNPDRVGDIIEPLGVAFRNPLPLLHQHNSQHPVGTVVFDKATKNGITFEARLPKIDEPGPLKDRIDTAWGEVKAGLVRAVSIGFRPLEGAVEMLKTGGLKFLKTEVLELSLVTVPANSDCTISLVKSIDTAQRAASGRAVDLLNLPGASGQATPKVPKEGNKMKTLAEQISALEATRAAKCASMVEIDNLVTEANRTKDASERETFETLQQEVKDIDQEIKDKRSLEQLAGATAKPVHSSKSQIEATIARSPIVIKETLPKGTAFTRYAMAVAAGKGSMSDTLAYAKRWDNSTPEVSSYIKAVAGTAGDGQGESASGTWGAELVYPTNLASEFVELLRPATIIGRIPGIRRVPFNVRITTQTEGSTVNWVGEAAAKPVSELAFGTLSLGYNKLAGIVVLSDELVRLSSPSAEEAVRRDLIDQMAQFMDEQFLDPSITATSTRPASVTQGVSATGATGTDADALYADLNTALAAFDDAEMSDASIVLLMPRALARGISALRNPLGQFEFSGLRPGGGELMGYPVIVSNSVDDGTIVIISANDILMADDGKVMLDASNQATLDMSGGNTPAFSLWQKNCVGIRAERWVTWAKRRADAVAMIDGAAYSPPAGSA